MNIAYDWFMRFGDKGGFDDRTMRNVLIPEFIAHAKTCADHNESEYIDSCVDRIRSEYQQRKLFA